jgi:hypothetical protein
VRDEVEASSVALWPEAEQVGVSCGDDRAALRAIREITAVTPWGEESYARPRPIALRGARGASWRVRRTSRSIGSHL